MLSINSHFTANTAKSDLSRTFLIDGPAIMTAMLTPPIYQSLTTTTVAQVVAVVVFASIAVAVKIKIKKNLQRQIIQVDNIKRPKSPAVPDQNKTTIFTIRESNRAALNHHSHTDIDTITISTPKPRKKETTLGQNTDKPQKELMQQGGDSPVMINSPPIIVTPPRSRSVSTVDDTSPQTIMCPPQGSSIRKILDLEQNLESHQINPDRNRSAFKITSELQKISIV
jgi:hypothetical protein